MKLLYVLVSALMWVACASAATISSSQDCARYGRKASVCQDLRNSGAPCEWLPVPKRGPASCAGSYGCHPIYGACGSYTCPQTCNARDDCWWNGGKCRSSCSVVGEACTNEYEVPRALSEPAPDANDLKLILRARNMAARALDAPARSKSTCCMRDVTGSAVQCQSRTGDDNGDEAGNFCCLASVNAPCEDSAECCDTPRGGLYSLECRNRRCRAKRPEAPACTALGGACSCTPGRRLSPLGRQLDSAPCEECCSGQCSDTDNHDANVCCNPDGGPCSDRQECCGSSSTCSGGVCGPA